MRNLEEENARLHEEIDQCREYVRSLGASGFGDLMEGVKMLLESKPTQESTVLTFEMTRKDITLAVRRMEKMEARLNEEPEYRTVAPFEYECIKIVLSMFASHVGADPSHALAQVEGQLGVVLKKMMEEHA